VFSGSNYLSGTFNLNSTGMTLFIVFSSNNTSNNRIMAAGTFGVNDFSNPGGFLIYVQNYGCLLLRYPGPTYSVANITSTTVNTPYLFEAISTTGYTMS
jgi:hypothetical protein